MPAKKTLKALVAANRWNFFLRAFGTALCTVSLLSCMASPAQAAITWSGNVDPADPNTWTSSTYAHVGTSAFGILTVDGGSDLWSYGGILGSNSGSTGTVTVTGAGSQWTNSAWLSVGESGAGILNIEAGGEVSNGGCALGYNSGSTGAATVTGAGSRWTNRGSLYVGYSGSGTLTVADGGVVSTGTLCASLDDLLGNGTITTRGAVLDADLVFDSSHGAQQTLSFGSGGRLNLNSDETGSLGVGYKGNGTLRIADGIAVASFNGYLGYHDGSTGTATVTGAGSKWINSAELYLGKFIGGRGTLNIEAGGQVIANGCCLGQGSSKSTGSVIVTGIGSNLTNRAYLQVGSYGIGILNINAGGQVSNTDCILGWGSGSAGTATVNGVGSKWTNSGDLNVGGSGSGVLNIEAGGQVSNTNGALGLGRGSAGTATITGMGSKWTNSRVLYVGDYGSGVLNIEAGGHVSNIVGYLGYNSGSTGTVTVTNPGSQWTTDHELYVGNTGNGVLNIAAGGQVSSSSSYLGYSSGAVGTVTVTGVGSQWTNSGDLYVGYSGSGALTVDNGGMVTAKTLYASLSSLSGNGTITAQGAVLDADLIFDSTQGVQPTIMFGAAGRLNLKVDSAALGAGYKKTGSLRIADGVAVHSYDGYLGYYSGSTGTATVTGPGSTWTNSTLYVGYWGNGTLKIDDAATVNSSTGMLGKGSGTTGAVTVTGDGSKWGMNNLSFWVGYFGNGTLNVEAGGQVSNTDGCLGYNSGSTGTATVSGPGSIWTNSGGLNVGFSGNGTLNVVAGGHVSNTYGYLGSGSGTTGTATVTGSGSKWTNSSLLSVGDYGNGTLNVEAGGQVSNTFGYLGYNSGSTGTATVTGPGSTWNNRYTLYVGYLGTGTLTVANGGVVTTGMLYASSRDLFGNGTITVTKGGLLDVDLVFNSTPQGTAGFGSGGTLNLGVSGTDELGVGYKDAGTLKITGGAVITSSVGYLGYSTGSTGTATVTGPGSTWTNSTLCVGNTGNGTLNVGGGTDSGGLVTAMTLTLAKNTKSTGTCNINNGGTLRTATIKNGAGIANFNWNDGVIQNYDANTNLTIPSFLTLKLAATGTHAFQVDLNRTATVGAVLSDASTQGTLTKTGEGTLTLNGNNSYSGGTTITAGTLIVGHANALGTTGTIVNNSTLVIAAGITLARPVTWGNATVLAGSGVYKSGGTFTVGTTTAGNASALSPGIGSGNVGTLTIGNHLSLDGATLMWDVASATSYDTLVVQGNLALNNTNTIVVPNLGKGVYNIMTYSGSLTGDASNLVTSSPPVLIRTGPYGFDVDTQGIIKMIVSDVPNYNQVWSGRASSAWNVPSSGNWTGGHSTFYNGDTVTFDDTSSVGTVQLTKVSATVALQPASVTVNNNTTAYTFSGDPISGAGSLIKSGGGTLTVNTANTYTGDTIIRGGTFIVGNPLAIPSDAGFGNVVLDGGTTAGALNLNGNSITLNGLSGISGAVLGRVINDGPAATLTVGGNNATSSFAGKIADGTDCLSLVKIGSGRLTLSGNNSYSGGLTLTSGTLNINNDAALGSGTLTISGGTIDNTSGGALINSGANAIVLEEDFTFGGAQNLDLGSGEVTLRGNRRITVSGNTLTLGGDITGAYSLVKEGAGSLTLSGNNDYSGGITLNAGRLNINSPTALGSSAGKVTISGVSTIDNTSGAPLTLSTNNPQAWNANFVFAGTQDLNLGRGPVTLGGNCVVTVSANTLTVGGNITGAYSWAKTGVGTLTLTGDNTFTGGMVLSGGRLNINSPTALGAATGKFSIYGTSTIDNTSGAPLTLSNNPQAWNTNFTFAGTQDLNLGIGPVTLSGDRVVTVSASTLTVGGKISGSYALTKAGLGTLALTAANTYTGATTINAGKLLVNGSLASPVTINGGGTLGGNGTITRLLTVNTAGTIAPGNSIGTLTLNGGLTLASGAKLDFELGPVNTSDLISMPSSALILNNQQFSDFHFTSMDGFGMGVYTLIDAKSISGSLGANTSGTINGLPATLYVDAPGSDLMLNVVPEPSTFALLGISMIGLLGVAWRRRNLARRRS